MPNWVYNSLSIEGNAEDISAIKTQLNKPFSRIHDSWDKDTGAMAKKEYKYSNPVFAFWNIIAPTDLETYETQPEFNAQSVLDVMTSQGNDWYNFNYREWGTKWDVAVHDEDDYPDTELVEEWTDRLIYRFNTAWSPPLPAIHTLSAQYHNLEFTLSYEEETGWGGEIEFLAGQDTVLENYENKCRDCDSVDTMEYCDNDCGEICSSCNYMGEADLDCVAECQTHKVFLDDEHVPDYRRETV